MGQNWVLKVGFCYGIVNKNRFWLVNNLSYRGKTMICVSIVEDEAAAAEKLKELLKKYSEKNNVLFNTTVYTDG